MQLQGKVLSSDTFKATSDQKDALGAFGYTADGRQFRYVQAGAVSLIPGNVLQAPAVDAGHLNLTVNTALTTAGASSIQGVSPQVAVNANYFACGTAEGANGGGIGYSYGISSHPAGNSTVNTVIQLTSAETVQVAANSTTRFNLYANPYKGVIQNPTSPSGTVVGVATYPIPNGQFGWAQTRGLAPVLIQGTPAVGAAVMPSASVAGAAAAAVQTAQAANTATTSATIGHMASTGVDGHVAGVFLKIE